MRLRENRRKTWTGWGIGRKGIRSEIFIRRMTECHSVSFRQWKRREEEGDILICCTHKPAALTLGSFLSERKSRKRRRRRRGERERGYVYIVYIRVCACYREGIERKKRAV